MSGPWLLLDRDDTILDDPGYLSDPARVAFLSGAIAGLVRFSEAGWPLVVISNQSGIGRGYFTLADLDAVHQRFRADLARHGVHLAGIYFCPHAPHQACDCRKPEPGLALRASAELDLPLHSAVMVGDKSSDIEMGHRIAASFVAQIAARDQEPIDGASGTFRSLDELADRLLGPLQAIEA